MKRRCKEGLDSGHIAGAALDVFAEEPAKDNALFGTRGLICTPHLGASTTEAQVNVAIQIAEQMSDYLLLGGITNAVNVPSLSAEEAPRLKPYMGLAEKLGRLVGQIAGTEIRSIDVEVEGAAAELNIKPITGAVLAGLMRTWSDTVNMVNAPYLAKERGIAVREIRNGANYPHRNASSFARLRRVDHVHRVRPVRMTPASTAPVIGLMLSSAAAPSTSTSIERISVPASARPAARASPRAPCTASGAAPPRPRATAR